ncbi:16S rRNA (guanine(966)-N(2))-methyltransferase RsmD [Lentibacillus amyloliquefaciens]|uniref:16S rRNA (Guanine(966)-N(2))-methyltransferase RsmD n=1 Tax=Lentibacillus amyloliquefaciens TaxID=1472767 RepID=A0A0U4DPV7_9BACI|nr:16S rRNA (guanine(966)-N(2))-methyltransferase RsmD [Lentibacillus amyloliquefaciens]ALX47368.1 16S rRNA (guanine(966)-N(2))-methyltransferase RsmD [Lentibacillus amyloliquefaciens]
MRVIAGIYKGHKLEAVPGKTTRPTSDKVKEAVFQALGPFFEGGRCLDLFAGSGALGIEALSRGMNQGIFVDKHPKAIHTIHKNLQALKLDDHAEVFRTDSFRAMNAAFKRGLTFDLILLDPPYQKVSYGKVLDLIDDFQLLNTDGLIYCEHDAFEQLPAESGRFSIAKQANYNDTTGITIYQNTKGAV